MSRVMGKLGLMHVLKVSSQISLWCPQKHLYKVITKDNVCWQNISLILGKMGLMHLHKVSSQISLCSQHRLIKDDIFCVFLYF